MVWYPLYVSGSKTFGDRTVTFRMIQTNHANITIEDIDGGGSTQTAYKDGGNRVCVQAEQRAVRTMVKTPM